MTRFQPDQYKGRQMYPKDTVTRKQMDRQDDRQTRRVDLHRDRLERLIERVVKLEAQQDRVVLALKALEDD